MHICTSTEKKRLRDTLVEGTEKIGDSLSFKRDGMITFKRGFFYRCGMSCEKLRNGILKRFPTAKIEDSCEDWKPWPKDSNFIVRFYFEEALPND